VIRFPKAAGRECWRRVIHRAGKTSCRVGDSQASVALWAFLHGAVALEAAEVLGESKPASGLGFGLDAWFMAVTMRGGPIKALQTKPTKMTVSKKASARESSARRGT
jgi:hypothetical protein